MKKYKLGFDIGELLLFLIIMIPNFIWFAVPAPNDVLRAESTTKIVDTVGTICQSLMIATLCIIINKERQKIRFSPLIIASCGCCLFYFACWGSYYCGMANAAVILGLTLPPCMAFGFFALDRKNYIAVFPMIGFTFCHLIYSVVNFIV